MRIFVITSFCFLASCVSSPTHQGPSVEHGFSTAAKGVGHLLLSPLQIATGLLEGIASLPYYLSTSLNEINQGLVNAQTRVTLDSTYQSVYGKSLQEVPESGDTGAAFDSMKNATQFFHRLLAQYGVPNSHRYVLTSLENGQYLLLAVVYRPVEGVIQISDKYTRKTSSLSPQATSFYVPFQHTAEGSLLDIVIDWAALPQTTVSTQKSQAILLTLAANSILNGKRSPDYWNAERRWLKGEVRSVVRERESDVRVRMGL